jgi:hypothetical protein
MRSSSGLIETDMIPSSSKLWMVGNSLREP